MLIKQVVLDQIATGAVDTQFRRQKRPTVKTGGTLRTAIGVLDIASVEEIELDEITPADARRAGFDSVEAVVASLVAKPDGAFLRVRLGLGGPDPRIALRQRGDLGAQELAEIEQRLDRFDRGSSRGAWTRQFLSMIAEQPHVRAPDLAASIGWETAPFKDNVRKLKTLGLTISHSPGYELSPRGHALLVALDGGLSRPRLAVVVSQVCGRSRSISRAGRKYWRGPSCPTRRPVSARSWSTSPQPA